jgi:hypothetical protein
MLAVVADKVRDALRPTYPAAPSRAFQPAIEQYPGAPGGYSVDFGEYLRRQAPLLDPVPLGESVVLSGGPGQAALIQAGPGHGPAAFTILVRNIGDQPVNGSLTSGGGAWLESDQGETLYAPQVRLLSSGNVDPTALTPGAELLLEMSFTQPATFRPARLIISRRLGDFSPQALWDLPTP